MVVTITKEEYDRLRIAYAKLSCLKINGVDNWDGYCYTSETMQEYYPEEYEMCYGEDK